MKIKYEYDMPVMEMTVIGPLGEKRFKAYVDTGAGRSLIPERDALRLGLPYVGDLLVITGAGKNAIKLYAAEVSFLGKTFNLLLLGKDLPEQSPIKAIIGRDILDTFKVCFNGPQKELKILE